jgi:hypothetical protein
MNHQHFLHSRHSQKGSVLITGLLMIAALSVIVSISLNRNATTQKTASLHRDFNENDAIQENIINEVLLQVKNHIWVSGGTLSDIVGSGTASDRYTDWYSDTYNWVKVDELDGTGTGIEENYKSIAYNVKVGDNTDGDGDYTSDSDNKAFVLVEYAIDGVTKKVQMLISPGNPSQIASAPADVFSATGGCIEDVFGGGGTLAFELAPGSNMSGVDMTAQGQNGCVTPGGCPGSLPDLYVGSANFDAVPIRVGVPPTHADTSTFTGRMPVTPTAMYTDDTCGSGSWEYVRYSCIVGNGRRRRRTTCGQWVYSPPPACTLPGNFSFQNSATTTYDQFCTTVSRVLDVANDLVAANDPRVNMFVENWGTTNVYGNAQFGTEANPEVLYIKSSSTNGEVRFKDKVTGYGIMVLLGNVVFEDDFEWNGIIYNDEQIAGTYMETRGDFDFHGGFLIKNMYEDTAFTSDGPELDYRLKGVSNIQYSSYALDKAFNELDPNYTPGYNTHPVLVESIQVL